MAMIDRAHVLDRLNEIVDPKSGQGLAAAGLVQGLALSASRAGFMIEVAAGDIALYEPVRLAAETLLATLPGIERAQVVLTSQADPAPYTPPEGAVRVRRGARLSDEAKAGMTPARPPSKGENPAHVKHIVAIASAKGGVGKSTAAVSLACAFRHLGWTVGLLDADIYGPSAPRMLGSDADPKVNADKKLEPISAFGLKAMSIGFIVDEGAPMIWRGPMASSALNQLIHDVAWGSAEAPLDILIIDLPPGTGDIQLTLAQKLSLDGAVLISTPQEIALIDVRRGAVMFQKTGVAILGVIENMAYFVDPSTGQKLPIFGDGGARRIADDLGAPFLGEVPIDMALRQACDDGRPLVATDPQHPISQRFIAMAKTLSARLSAKP